MEPRQHIIDTYRQRKSRSYALIERMLRSYLRPYLWLLGLGVLANVVVAGTTSALPWFIQQAIDKVFGDQNTTMLLLIPIGVVAISVTRGAATYGSNVIMGFVGQRTTSNLQRDLFAHLVRGDLARVTQQHSGEYISLFMNDATRLRDTVNTTIINIVRHLLTVVALTIFMYVMNVQMALIYTMIVIPLGVVFMRRLGRVTRKASRQGLEEIGGLSTLISETLGGLRIVKAYGQEADQITRAGSTIDTLLSYTMRSVRARAAASPAIEMLAGIAIGVIIFYGGYQSTQGNLTAGEFMGFISALLMAYQPLRAVANLQTVLQEGVSAGERIFTVLDATDEIIDVADAQSLDIKHGAISFENVTFGYAGRDTPALDAISLDVPAGQTVALVGASGSGKSTLLNLTLRFFDIDTGRITIDDQNIRDVSLDSLRSATALVTQEPFLFDDTIAKNIAFGNVDASQADIERAARSAAANEFICALPQGYDTPVGEGGIRLSGGQKQRLAIARAILKDAPILLLDEATSALDTVSEAQVQKALEKLLEGRTALIIAHRLSTVMHADRIYVLEHGRLRETGTHNDLLAADGLYAELYRTQFQESEN